MSASRWIALLALATIGMAPRAEAQGVGLSLSMGAAASVAEVAARKTGAGVTIEVAPDWRFRSGLSLGLGFRYTAYPDLPGRNLVFVDARYTRPAGAWRPTVGLRAGGFQGGDEDMDDPYIGLEIGPVVGVERTVGEHLSVQALGSIAGVLALYRSARVLPSLQVGLVIR